MPQMMPLPWVVIFVFLFVCFYSFIVYFSFFYGSSVSSLKSVKASKIIISW